MGGPEKEQTEGTVDQLVKVCGEGSGGLQAKLQERLCVSIERIIGVLDTQFDTVRQLYENNRSLAEDVNKLRKTTEEQGLRYPPLTNHFTGDQSRWRALTQESPTPPVVDGYSCRRILPRCGGVERAAT